MKEYLKPEIDVISIEIEENITVSIGVGEGDFKDEEI